MDDVADKMVGDFDDTDPRSVPSFSFIWAMSYTALAKLSIITISSTIPIVITPRRYLPSPATTMAWWHRTSRWKA